MIRSVVGLEVWNRRKYLTNRNWYLQLQPFLFRTSLSWIQRVETLLETIEEVERESLEEESPSIFIMGSAIIGIQELPSLGCINQLDGTIPTTFEKTVHLSQINPKWFSHIFITKTPIDENRLTAKVSTSHREVFHQYVFSQKPLSIKFSEIDLVSHKELEGLLLEMDCILQHAYRINGPQPITSESVWDLSQPKGIIGKCMSI